MKCPYCMIGVRIDLQRSAYQVKGLGTGTQRGIEVSHGLCPECDNLLVYLREGQYRWRDDAAEIDPTGEEQRVYPLGSSWSLDPIIPEPYRSEFLEAALLVELSPRSSAALSRRLMQFLIRKEYSITKKTLHQEIGEFLQISDLPQQLRDSVDIVRQVGNLAAHPESTVTGEIAEVETGEASWLLEVLDLMLEFRFVKPARESERIDRLNDKLKKLGKPMIVR